MTSRYFFEISPRALDPNEPIDLTRSFELELPGDILEGIYSIAYQLGAVSEFPFDWVKMRIFEWDPAQGDWVPFHPALTDLKYTHPFVGDTNVSISDLVNDPNTPYTIFRDVLAPFSPFVTFKKYTYIFRVPGRDRISIYTSDYLTFLQGMLTAAQWLGRDYRDVLLYILEDDRPMRIE